MKSRVLQNLPRHWDLLTSVLIGGMSFIFFLPFARLDFDQHHDGYMTAAALAVADGKVIHRDVFMQYGPLLTLLQSTFVQLPLPPSLALRVLNALLLALSIGIIADLGRRAPTWLRVSKIGAKFAAVMVLVLCDFFYGVPMLPWSSTLLILLIVVHLYFLIVGLYFESSSDKRKSLTLLALSGVFLGLTFFVRPAIFVALFVVLLCVLVVGVLARQRLFGLVSRSVLFATVSVGFGLLALATTGALKPFWQQNIAWGSSYLDLRNGWITVAASETLTYLPLFVILLLCAATLWALGKRRLLSPAVSVCLSVGVVVVAFAATIPFTYFRRSHRMLVAGPFGDTPVFALMSMVYWVLLILSVLTGIGVLIVLIKQRSSSRGLILFWVSGISLVSLSQSFPVPDSRHYFWSIASGVLLIPLLISHIPTWPRRSLILGGVAVVVVAGVTSLHATVNYLDIPRIPGSVGAINEAMLSSPSGTGFLTNFNDSYEFLSTAIPSGASALFLTPDGANAAFDGSYRSVDTWFVNWGPVPALNRRLNDVQFVIAERELSERDLSTLRDFGFVESASTIRLSVFRRPSAVED